MKRRRVKRMSPTAVIDFTARKQEKEKAFYTQVMGIKKLTKEQMISSNKKRREE